MKMNFVFKLKVKSFVRLLFNSFSYKNIFANSESKFLYQNLKKLALLWITPKLVGGRLQITLTCK